ncbi:hypothetical protein [Dyadobacter bucti]|uniref:hypothetical protein n=1 Tax=Dyadobacter bucti TaxID=2572203 RepID=UPI001109C595|nr:hypothetical protein [Dyadobacter bucti]
MPRTISIDCEKANIETAGRSQIRLEIQGHSDGEILDQFTIQNILKWIDDDKFLDVIGIERVKEYFNLTESVES